MQGHEAAYGSCTTQTQGEDSSLSERLTPNTFGLILSGEQLGDGSHFKNIPSALRCGTKRLSASYRWSRSYFMWAISLRVWDHQMHSYPGKDHGVHSQPHFLSLSFHTLWSCTLLWHHRFRHTINSSSVTACSSSKHKHWPSREKYIKAGKL